MPDALKPRPPKRRHNLEAAKAYAPLGPPEAAAFFDFDKTLLHGDAGVIFGRTLTEWAYEQGLQFPLKPMRTMWNAYITTKLGAALGMEVFFRSLYGMKILKRSQLVKLGYRFLKGFPEDPMMQQMERVWERVLSKRIYPSMKEVLARHRSLGQRIIIVTTGMRPIVEMSKRYLGDDIEIIACDLEVGPDGYWTGKVEGPLYGAHKAEAVREYARKHHIDLSKSYAYSDHYSDIEFLAAVGNPVCVNPKRRLRRIAAERGWTILDLPRPMVAVEPAAPTAAAIEK